MEAIKHRVIHVEGMTCEGCERSVIERLLSKDGIRSVEADSQTGRVEVCYDLLKINLKTIESEIIDLGYRPNVSFLGKIRSGWAHFTEENEHGNLTAKSSPCCSNPDEHLAKKQGDL